MVFRKKSEGGSVVRRPRKRRDTTLAPVKRSARLKKKQMYALDLLATVAESLSSDEDDYSTESDQDVAAASHNSDRAAVKAEQFHEAPQLNSTALENDCCRGYTVGCDCICAPLGETSIRKTEDLSTQNVADTVEGSLIEKADADNLLTQNVADAAAEPLIEKKPDVFAEGSLVSCTKPSLLDCGLGTIPEYGTIGVCHPCFPTSADVKQVHQATPAIIGSLVDGNAAALHGLVDTMDLDIKPSVLNSESSSGVHLGGHDNGHNSSPFYPVQVQHAADIDNDEKSTRCVHPSTSGSKGGHLSYKGDCRTRRLLSTRMRKAARNKMCGELPNKGSKFGGKKISATRRRAQMQRMLKTKKVVECYSAQPSDEGVLTETSGTSCSRGGQDPTCASESSQRKPCASEGCNVKFIIKSFNIPELSIEVPENATVGSLKRIVMDAVTSKIEGSLSVSVLLQGEIIQDDNKTLHQAGICHGAKPDSIGFTLECEAKQDSRPSGLAPEEMDSAGPSVVNPLSKIKFEQPFISCTLGDYPCEGAAQVRSEICQAIVPYGTSNPDALAIVPVVPRSRQRDFGQRRKRRPFSVAEVELLVEAVELLGFGRWKNVKNHAFRDNEERTYVDLKDKWKNLVHTASIPPQLRRGRAIPPQGLLDRVLAAQAYWTVHHAKRDEEEGRD
ncbi:hypothetical protein CFC21_090201 [Triticum aestivum]|uniref:Telomere-binding protein 1 n=3 Tax=Triticum TaxID=4564 RepID=A0A9R0YWN7_TRITD|nr:telomere-binding protein 1-like [Triticum aestivum]KAF7086969.1 hypothetical protein CFC21_090201 [Triticum aestivum]VAI63112.1 unnamed protein product [Triticum turgidum subsp. durum]